MKRTIGTWLSLVMILGMACSGGSFFGKSSEGDTASSTDKKPSEEGEGVEGYLVDPQAILAYKADSVKDYVIAAPRGTLREDALFLWALRISPDYADRFLVADETLLVSEAFEIISVVQSPSDRSFSFATDNVEGIVLFISRFDAIPEYLALSQTHTYFISNQSRETLYQESTVSLLCDSQDSAFAELYFSCQKENSILFNLDEAVIGVCSGQEQGSLESTPCDSYTYDNLIETPSEFSATTGFTQLGAVQLDLSMNDEAKYLKSVKIRYQSGLIPPSDCQDSGSEVFSSEAPESTYSFNHNSEQSGQTFASYRACVELVSGTLREYVANGILVANPGPVCMRPPCTPARSSGNGTFASPIDVTGSDSFLSHQGELVDLNNDGYLDYIVLQYHQTIAQDSYIFYGQGNGQFSAASALSTSMLAASGLVLGDFNNDSIIDAFVATQNVTSDDFVYWGQNVAGFSGVSNISKGGSYMHRYGAAGDVDKDGNLDIITSSVSSGIPSTVISSNGTALSDGPNIGTTNEQGKLPIVADFDKDGDLDILETRGNTAVDTSNLLYLNPGSGDFSGVAPIQFGTAVEGDFAGVAGDVNGDGSIDVVICSYTGVSQLFYGNGDATFSSPVNLTSIGDSVRHCVLADFNNDGYLDLIAARYLAESKIAFGNGSGFGAASSISTEVFQTRHMAVGDLNGDQKLDLIFLNQTVDRVLLGN